MEVTMIRENTKNTTTSFLISLRNIQLRPSSRNVFYWSNYLSNCVVKSRGLIMGIWEDKENINLSIVLLLLDKEQLIIVRVYIINVAHGFSILKRSRYSNKAFRNMEALCQFTKM